MIEVAEECLARLRDARALSVAEHFPGTQVTMEVVMPGHERAPERYAIVDVKWSKPDSYHYVAWQITNVG